MSYNYFAFLDVMGYREHLKKDIESGEEQFKEKLINAFRVFEHIDSSEIKYKSISDSIFISVNQGYDVNKFFDVLKKIWIAFLEQGLLLRGGVSYDSHFENQHITYSKALTDAYNIESQQAFFPRIVVNNNIFDITKSEYKTFIIKSGDDYIIDVVTSENVIELYEHFKKIAYSNHSSIRKSAQIRSKYLWLQEYFLFRNPALGKYILEWTEAFE